MLGVESRELADHLGHLALGEWSRFSGRRDIEVVGHDRDGPLEAHVTIPALRPVVVRTRRKRRGNDPAGELHSAT